MAHADDSAPKGRHANRRRQGAIRSVPLFRPPPPSPPPSTLPALMRASDFKRREGLPPQLGDTTTRLSSLSAALVEDLRRFEAARPGEALDVLEVLAAAVRHGRNLRVHVRLGEHVLPLTVFAIERVVHTRMPVAGLLSGSMGHWRAIDVAPAQLALASPGVRPLLAAESPGPAAAQAPAQELSPLGPLLWALALRGHRAELLPEIGGTMAYRIAPGAAVEPLGDTAYDTAVQRLRRQTSNLRDIASWPGMNEERATRLLNGLYLQAALVLSRSHPAAINDGWDGGQTH